MKFKPGMIYRPKALGKLVRGDITYYLYTVREDDDKHLVRMLKKQDTDFITVYPRLPSQKYAELKLSYDLDDKDLEKLFVPYFDYDKVKEVKPELVSLYDDRHVYQVPSNRPVFYSEPNKYRYFVDVQTQPQASSKFTEIDRELKKNDEKMIDVLRKRNELLKKRIALHEALSNCAKNEN